MIDEALIQDLDAQQLRQVVRTLIADVSGKDAQIAFKQTFIDKLTHEMAVLKRLKFEAQSEAYSGEQRNLLEEAIDIDLATAPTCRATAQRLTTKQGLWSLTSPAAAPASIAASSSACPAKPAGMAA